MTPPPKNIFSKHQNKAEFKNLDDSEVHQSPDSDDWIIPGTKITNICPPFVENPIFHR